MKRRRSRSAGQRARGAYFTRGDAKAWRRLIREAKACAANLDDQGGDFARAADAAFGCCFPWPVIKGREVSTAFRALIEAGRGWAMIDRAERLARSDKLASAIVEAERILGPAPAKPGSDQAAPRLRHPGYVDD